MDLKSFQNIVINFYKTSGRQLPWRILSDDEKQRFYEVLVSEIMLQQTQVGRVTEKYNQWMDLFPSINHAAGASFVDILRLWQGLGYNRRARYLLDSIGMVNKLPKPPKTTQDLVSLPGVGENTAGAILAYCYNQPAVFIETNIRSVFLYHFPQLSLETKVKDSEIKALLQQTINTKNPREWYWALMDYGTYLKSQGFKNHASAHYAVQSKFSGSMRQLRGLIIRQVLKGPVTVDELEEVFDDSRVQDALKSLVNDRTLEIEEGCIKVSLRSVK